MISYMATMMERIIQYTSPSEILDSREDNGCMIGFERLLRICFAAEDNRSESAIEKSLEYLAGWLREELLESGHMLNVGQDGKRGIHFFDLVECFSSKMLTMMKGEVVFWYKYLEPWQRASAKIGSDMFVANAYAFHDQKYGKSRTSFLWKTVLGHDNYSLDCILKKGISDNHYHLLASLPYFDLSWISLMNSVTQIRIFKYLDSINTNSRSVRKRYITDAPSEKYEILHLKAALIRAYLYSVLTDQLIQLEDYPVSMDWLLEYLMEVENPQYYLGNVDFSLRGNGEEDKIGQRIMGFFASDNLQAEGRTINDFKRDCPGIYWLFVECYPEIPIRILPDPSVFGCKCNIYAICNYLEGYDRKLLLRQCRWLFEGRDFEKYRAEWKRMTKETVYYLLQNPRQLIYARKYIQSVLEGFQLGQVQWEKDYLLNEVDTEPVMKDEYVIVSGERWLMYTMFRNRYHPLRQDLERREDIYELFFLYLIIKDRFRRELLYNNEKIGFRNFQEYQRRKTWFTTSFTIGELAKIAVRQAFASAELKSLELRISPGETVQDNIRIIQNYDKNIQNKGNDKLCKKYYYVFHFRKKKDQLLKVSHVVDVRNGQLRRELIKKTDAILLMREKNHKVGSRLRGVDACSSEDGCRPEVFATAFRVLKNHIATPRSQEKKMPQLRLSYHVGEENQDVLDGIRAVDEAVYFLNMGNGDRLGHATMLGVDAAEWYRKNENKISIRQQDYLDNIVWLYQRMIHYQLSNQSDLLEYLEREFYTYFERVYREALDVEYSDSNLKDFDIHNYYAAWELRGDNPEYYKSGYYDRSLRRPTIWGDYGINRLAPKENRHMEKAVLLYHAYHYSYRVREAGKKSIVKSIPEHMIQGIQEVQKKMMKKIARKGIAIETNPSSNVLIGGLNYGQHPITAFYNKGLTNNRELLDSCAQIRVSINTDDLGVFITSLPNEYALMARALEDLVDENGVRIYKKDMVYDWINRVRKMGNEQSFRKI